MFLQLGSLLTAFLTLLDLKQVIFIGQARSKSYSEDREIRDGSVSKYKNPYLTKVNSYKNPVISTNTPDPGVVKLVDGSGWAAVATSNYASRSGNASAFPLYYSSGRDILESYQEK